MPSTVDEKVRHLTFGNLVSQEPVVKLQILTLAARLFVLCPNARAISLLTMHLLQLARYDKDWDVRDRGRFLKALLRGIKPSAKLDEAQTDPMTAPGEDDDEEREAGGVILRREQVQVVLYGGRDVHRRVEAGQRELFALRTCDFTRPDGRRISYDLLRTFRPGHAFIRHRQAPWQLLPSAFLVRRSVRSKPARSRGESSSFPSWHTYEVLMKSLSLV